MNCQACPPDPSSFDKFTKVNPNFSFIFPHIVSKTIRCYLIADLYAEFMFTLVGILCSRMTAGNPFLFLFHFYFYIRSGATVITEYLSNSSIALFEFHSSASQNFHFDILKPQLIYRTPQFFSARDRTGKNGELAENIIHSKSVYWGFHTA